MPGRKEGMMQTLDRYNERLVKGKPSAGDKALVCLGIFLVIAGIIITLYTLLGLFVIAGGIYLTVNMIHGLKVEFEYTISDGNTDIDIIRNKSRRKRLREIEADRVIVMRRADSDKAKNDLTLSEYKISDYTSGEMSERIYAMYLPGKNKKEIVLLDLDEASAENMRLSLKNRFEK